MKKITSGVQTRWGVSPRADDHLPRILEQSRHFLVREGVTTEFPDMFDPPCPCVSAPFDLQKSTLLSSPCGVSQQLPARAKTHTHTNVTGQKGQAPLKHQHKPVENSRVCWAISSSPLPHGRRLGAFASYIWVWRVIKSTADFCEMFKYDIKLHPKGNICPSPRSKGEEVYLLPDRWLYKETILQ